MNISEAFTTPDYSSRLPDTVEAYRRAQGEAYIVKAAAIATTAFEVAGQGNDPICRLYNALLERPQVCRAHIKLAAVVMESLGRIHQDEQMKHANTAPMTMLARIQSWLSNASGAARSGAAVAPEAARALMTLGAATGGLFGGGAWLTQHMIRKEDPEMRQLELQRDTYRKLTSEVRNELQRRKMAPTPENTAAAVDYLT